MAYRPSYQPLPSDVEEDHPYINPGRPGATNLQPHPRVIQGPYSTQHQLVTGKSTFAPSVIPAVNGQQQHEDIIPRRHPYEGYKIEQERLDTFADWPSNAFVSKHDLARNGFIYTHINDRVQCVFCRGILSSWENGDVVEDEHKRTCPECAFAYRIDACGNVPLNPAPPAHTGAPPQHTTVVSTNVGPASYNTTVNIAVRPQSVQQHSLHVAPYNNSLTTTAETLQPPASALSSLTIEEPAVSPHNRLDANPAVDVPLPSLASGPPSACVQTNEPKYKDWADERLRVQSFVGWPSQMVQVPTQLAAAGLLYMGFGDRCKCFWCGGELYDWEPCDVPIEEHAKWFSHCNFVRNLKGDAYIQYVKDKQNGLIVGDEEIMTKPHVLAVLQEGYTAEQVQEVLRHYGHSRLCDATVLRKAIDDLQAERRAFFNQASTQRNVVPYDDVEMEENTQDFPSTVHVTDPAISGKETKSETKDTTTKSSGSRPGTSGSTGSDTGSAKGVDTVLKENEQLRDQRLCKICLDKDLSIVFLPCGHLATCEECSETLFECPMCRKGISQKVKTFWS